MIDLHTHVVPERLPFAASGPGDWPRLRCAGDTGDVTMGERHFRTVGAAAWSAERRLDEMGRAGVTHQVLSAMPELFCTWAEPQQAALYCRGFNEWMAAQAAASGGALLGLGLVPMQDPAAAAEMLAEIDDLGLLGIEIGTNVDGVPLHDHQYDEVFDELRDRDLLVFVHGFHPAAENTFSSPLCANGVLMPNEIGYAIGGLIAEGAFERASGLRLVASHGGGSLATLLPRLDFMWHYDESLHEVLPVPPSEYARQVHVDTMVFSPRTVSFIADVLGDDRLVVGSDYPFMPQADPDLLAHLDDAARERVARGNATRLLRLDASPSQTDPWLSQEETSWSS